MTKNEADRRTAEVAIELLKPGGVASFSYQGHLIAVVRTSLEGCHTGRPRYFVGCETCDVLLHPATTGLWERIEYHLNYPAIAQRTQLDGGVDLVADLRAKLAEPVPMRLPCPACHMLHIDTGEFATKPHHTHACQSCGNVWRPALVPTVGVRFLPGFKNEEPSK